MSEGAWQLVSLDEKTARKFGVPKTIPVPKGALEDLEKGGLEVETLRRNITTFLSQVGPTFRTEHADTAKGLERFIAKVDVRKKAEDALKRGDVASAISTLKMVVNVDPDDHAAALNLAMAVASQGNTDDAIARMKRVRDTFEGDADFHHGLGQLYFSKRMKEEATAEFVSALEANPSHRGALDALVRLGELYAVYENPLDAASLVYLRRDAATSYLREAWEKSPPESGLAEMLAGYHGEEGRHDVVLALVEIVRTRTPLTPKLLLLQCESLRALERFADAKALAEAHRELGPEFCVEVSRALRGLGDEEGAQAALRGALAQDPGCLPAIFDAFFPASTDDLSALSEKLPLLADHAAAHPRSPGALRMLARALAAVGKVQEAADAYARAVAEAPEDDDLRAEQWTLFGKESRWGDILAEAAKLPNMAKRDVKLRWNEAEALLSSGKKVEAQAAFSAISMDDRLHVDLRKRAKRAVLRGA